MAESEDEVNVSLSESRETPFLTDAFFGWLGRILAGLVTIAVLFFLFRIAKLVDTELFVKIIPNFGKALYLVAKIVVVSSVLSVSLGIFVGLGRISTDKFTGTVAKLYVEFFRGTPLLFQLMVIFVGVPKLFWGPGEFPIADWGVPAAIIGLTLNHSAYIGEAIKGGINAVPNGQMEAARSLGLSYVQAMQKIILPQAFRNALAAIGNDQVILIKDTSLLTLLAVPEIMSEFRNIANREFDPWTPIVLAAICYLMLTVPLGMLVRKLEEISAEPGEEDAS